MVLLGLEGLRLRIPEDSGRCGLSDCDDHAFLDAVSESDWRCTSSGASCEERWVGDEW